MMGGCVTYWGGLGCGLGCGLGRGGMFCTAASGMFVGHERHEKPLIDNYHSLRVRNGGAGIFLEAQTLVLWEEGKEMCAQV